MLVGFLFEGHKMTCGIEEEAKELFTQLAADLTVRIPSPNFSGPEWEIPGGTASDLYRVVEKLRNEDLTTGITGGTGTFDILMRSIGHHIQTEHKNNRITGAEYTKAYIAAIDSALGSAVQFLLGKDAAYWNAVTAQLGALTAKVQLQNAMIESARLQLDAATSKANYALTKSKIGTESINYCVGKFQLEQMLPTQQLLVKEQIEVQSAQTKDIRTDGIPVTGVIGKQKELHSQQIDSYKKDIQLKAARIFTDAWITQKTLDDEIIPPTNFNNASVNNVLQSVKDEHGFS